MKNIRCGLIGLNGVGQYHIKFIHKNNNAQLTAISDINPQLLKENTAKHEVKGFTDYKKLISSNLADAIIICTPHDLHAEMAMECLDAGLHILIEKPLAITVSDADRIIQKANDKKLNVSVGHQYRTHRSSQIAKNIIDSGKIGKIMRVLWSWNSFKPENYFKNKPWHATWRESGAGVLMNQVSHDLDLICWLIGNPYEVNAMLGNQLHSVETEDIACVNVLFESGAHGSFQFSINQPQAYSVRQIVGEKGAIFFNDVKSLTFDMDDEITLCTYDDVNKLVNNNSIPTTQITTKRLEDLKKKRSKKGYREKIISAAKNKFKEIVSVHNSTREPSWFNYEKPVGREALVNNFIDSIIKGIKPEINAENTLKTVELINAIILSAFKKRNVTLPINRNEFDELFCELSEGKITIPKYKN